MSVLSLQDYLKKYTVISSKFIDDFFSLYDYNTDDNDFVVDLDIIVKWLKARKDSLKDTLKKTYINDVDYKIHKKKSSGGRPSETILLTPDCFKRLSMQSNTKKSRTSKNILHTIRKTYR